MFRALADIYEPSAIQQLPDGRFLIVEDEKAHPFSLLTLLPDGSNSRIPLEIGAPAAVAGLDKLDDLEGLAVDTAGFVYAITSHSRNSAGEEKKSREKLVRFRVEGNRLVAPVVVKGLKSALVQAHPVLASAAAVLQAKTTEGLNIEALEMTPDGQCLLLGFRSPLLEQRALVARLENPAAVFAAQEPPRLAPQLITLDLGGHGLRGMSYIPVLGGYLLISGPVAKEAVQFQLWFWNGLPDEAPRRVQVSGLPGFAHAEGICPAVIDGAPRIVIVSDDGSRADGRPARFLLLAPEQLQI